MAQTYAFLAYGATQVIPVTNGAVTTVSVGTSTTGLPATAVRIWNATTDNVFIQFATGGVPTVSVTAGQPVPKNAAANYGPQVLRTGGNAQMLMIAAARTVTVYWTAGEGLD